MYKLLAVQFYTNPPAGLCVLIFSSIFFYGSVASIFLLYSATIFNQSYIFHNLKY